MVPFNFLSLGFLMFVAYSFSGFKGCHGQCPEEMVQCNLTKVCLPIKYICDGDADCKDAEDEINCSSRVSGCGGPFELHGTTGELTSMNYPIAYDNHATCHWHIIAPKGENITLLFVDVFDVEKARHDECIYDGISVYGRSAHQFSWPVLFGRYCGNVPPDPIKTAGNEVFIEFQTDKQLTGRGFKIMWTAGEEIEDDVKTTKIPTNKSPLPCEKEVTGIQGTISTPGFQQGQPYPENYHCTWRIKVQSHHRVALDFSYLRVGTFYQESCQGAWVRLFDGPDTTYPLIAEFCDAILPSEILSTSRIVTVEFWSEDNQQNLKGFELAWSQVELNNVITTLRPLLPGCYNTPLEINSTEGFLTSPYFSLNDTYPFNMNCEWHLISKPGTVFYIKFEHFDLEESRNCSYDSLSFYDIASNTSDNNKVSLISNNCGIVLPFDIISQSNHVMVKFITDQQVSGVGFNISYEAKAPPIRCQKDEFQCKNKECIPLSTVCDGMTNCNDSSDELICPLAGKCGVSSVKPSLVNNRIVGGEESVEDAWPWTLSVVKKMLPQCGATLILPNWALSAAHCFNFVDDRNYQIFDLIAGRHQLGVSSRNEQIRQVANVFIPKDYDSQTSFHDIALVKLKSPFNITNNVSPACLPERSPSVGSSCYITGWGETLTTCCKDLLKQAEVPVMNTSLCSQPDYYGDRIKDGMMCAGFPDGGVDACGGDSGGPLVCPSPRHQDQWELQGITSWGQFCALAKNPGVYTRVFDFLPWIQQTIVLNDE